MKTALLLTTGLLLASHSWANEALAKKNGCTGCHAMASALVGPAFKDVAAKYADQADAKDQLIQSIRQGSSGKWGQMPMPPQAQLSASDSQKLALWVLKIK
jgi:cytochrome c